eukprot:6492330-Amphidinium_carterae.1
MALEFDRAGVPMYAGEAELWDEYRERALDLYHGRLGEEAKQKATALHLRAGLRGLAYEAARGLAHDQLKGLEGVELLIKTLQDTVAKEAPVRTTELFDAVFYSRTVARGNGESIHAYLVRRRREVSELSKLSPETTLSQELQSQLLLKHAGLTHAQKTQALSAAGGSFKLADVEKALRTLFTDIHQHDHVRRQQAMWQQQQGKSYGKGKKNGKVRQAFVTDLDTREEGSDWTEWPDESEALLDDSWVEPPPSEEWTEPGMEEDAWLDASEGDGELAEAYAAVIQAEALATQTRQHFVKGKGKQSKGSSKALAPSGPAVPPTMPMVTNDELPFKASGTMQFERARKLASLKAKTKCAACGQKGHWAQDATCPKKKSGSTGKGQQSYFVIAEPIPEEACFSQMMAVASTASASRSSKKGAPVMAVPCEHAMMKTGAIQRGANALTRHLQCRTCQQLVVRAQRWKEGEKRAGVELWKYLVCVLFFHRDGAKLRAVAGFRGAGRLAGPDMQTGELPALPLPVFMGDGDGDLPRRVH